MCPCIVWDWGGGGGDDHSEDHRTGRLRKGVAYCHRVADKWPKHKKHCIRRYVVLLSQYSQWWHPLAVLIHTQVCGEEQPKLYKRVHTLQEEHEITCSVHNELSKAVVVTLNTNIFSLHSNERWCNLLVHHCYPTSASANLHGLTDYKQASSVCCWLPYRRCNPFVVPWEGTMEG